MENLNIGFIGGGNMARSLIGGLIGSIDNAQKLRVSEPDADKRRYFQETFGVQVYPDNDAIADSCDVIVLAVKPQMLREVLLPLQARIRERKPLLVSIVAGIREPDIRSWAGGDAAIVRAMPNTPALVGSGATGLYANTAVTESQRNIAESVMRAVGVAVWLPEEILLDAVTALSGSGPAYFMYFMEALENSAIEHGLDADTARLLTLETCLGAAKLAMESGEDLAELRRRVTSPGGTTEKAISVLRESGLPDIVARAFAAASTRADELARILGAQKNG